MIYAMDCLMVYTFPAVLVTLLLGWVHTSQESLFGITAANVLEIS